MVEGEGEVTPLEGGEGGRGSDGELRGSRGRRDTDGKREVDLDLFYHKRSLLSILYTIYTKTLKYPLSP